jgi:hypothetical protein
LSNTYPGRLGLTKVFTGAVSPGALISFTVPVKTFIIKPVGGNINFRFNSTDADADAFPINDGEAFQFDIAPRFPSSTNVSNIGYITGVGIPVYVAITF